MMTQSTQTACSDPACQHQHGRDLSAFARLVHTLPYDWIQIVIEKFVIDYGTKG
jgi:hypothetical protein